MDKAKENLKRNIEQFVEEGGRVLHLAKTDPAQLKEADLESLAQKIWDLRHFALELLSGNPNESDWYNASIIKEFIDEPLQIEGSNEAKYSLIQAADLIKKERNDLILKKMLSTWSLQNELQEVLFSNLQLISRELAA